MIPNYLKPYLEKNGNDPRKANLDWFKNARYGLFMHYGLYSLSADYFGLSPTSQEWIQNNKKIHVKDYEILRDNFTAKDFNAEEIVSFAKNAGMKYINITTRHHDCFCLFETKETDYQSLNSPAKRDLVKELVDECEKQDMAIFLYYSHGRDWRHPHAPNNDEYAAARPEFEIEEPMYKYGEEHDIKIYVDFLTAQVKELLNQYPTVAGIWFDGHATPASGNVEVFKTQELYDLIHETSEHAILSYKQGMLGTEDFFAPEHSMPKEADNNDDVEEYQKHNDKMGKIDKEKIIEVCTTMISDPVSWGYKPNSKHLSVQEVEEKIATAVKENTNLLLNIGLMPDGGIEDVDKEVLLKVGEKIKSGEIKF